MLDGVGRVKRVKIFCQRVGVARDVDNVREILRHIGGLFVQPCAWRIHEKRIQILLIERMG